MTEFSASEWKRAEGALASAEILVDVDPNSAASRAYYAAFHAVTALFALRGQFFRRHSAVRAAVHRDLVQAEGWSPEFGQDYDFLLDLRSAGDYGGTKNVLPADAHAAVDTARRFLSAVAKACPEIADASA